MKIKISILIFVLLIPVIFVIYKYFSPDYLFNSSASGRLISNQIWSGNIFITGDVEIFGNLTILPSTTIKFFIGDDRHRGDEVPADGFNNNDPTRLKSYTTTHASLFVLGKLIAKGSKSQPIIFTSAAEKPNLADWEAVIFRGNGSVIDNVVVEYTRNGLNPIGQQPDSVIQNSISRHALWGTISSANSNITIKNNQLSDAGHEGIDLKYNGSQEVSGNIINDCHTGIASIGGSQIIKNNMITNCGDGVFIAPDSKAISLGNTFVSAPDESQREWRYGDYSIPIFGYPDITSTVNNK